MKKLLIASGTVIAISLLSFTSTVKQLFTDSETTKHVNVEVYRTASYSSSVYEDAYASLQVTVVRTNGVTKDTVWQHTYEPRQLKEFPNADKPMVQTISVPGVKDNKEKIEIVGNLVYTTKGSTLNLCNATEIGKGEHSGKLDVQI